MVKHLAPLQQNQNSLLAYLEIPLEQIEHRQILRKHKPLFPLILRVHIVTTSPAVLQPLDNDLAQFFRNRLYNFQLKVVKVVFSGYCVANWELENDAC